MSVSLILGADLPMWNDYRPYKTKETRHPVVFPDKLKENISIVKAA